MHRSVVVLVKRYIELPMEIILDAPMVAEHSRVVAGTCLLAADEIANLAAGFALDRALTMAHAYDPQLPPTLALAYPLGLGDHHVAPCLLAAVPLFRFLIRLVITALDAVLQHLAHTLLNVIEQVLLVVLDRQHVIPAARHDLFRDRLLAADGVDAHHGPMQVQQLQQLGDGRDLVRLGIDGHLTQAQMMLGGPGTDQVQRPQARRSRATQRLAVNGDMRHLQDSAQVQQPLPQARLKSLRVDKLEQPLKRVVGWDVVRQSQEPFEPNAVSSAKQCNGPPTVGATDNGANGDDNDVQETMFAAVPTARVAQFAKVGLDGQGIGHDSPP